MTTDRHTAAKARDALYFDAPPAREYLHQRQPTPKGSYNLYADYRLWRPEADGTITLTLAIAARVADSPHFAAARAAIAQIAASRPAKRRVNGERDITDWTLAIKRPADVAALGRIVAAVDAAIEAAAADEAAAKAAAKAKANREWIAKQAQDKIISAYWRLTEAARGRALHPRAVIALSAARNVAETLMRQAAAGDITPPDNWDVRAAITRNVKLALIDDPTGARTPTPILDATTSLYGGIAHELARENKDVVVAFSARLHRR